MPFEIKEITLSSTDNIHTLVGRIYIPEGEIKGLFHIVHGMTEHIERYSKIMEFLAENGFVAFGYDNLGHGKTATDESELGFIAHNDGWKYLVNDVAAFDKAIMSQYPDKKLVLMGHSMGSFIVRLAAESFGELYDKLIICGTGGKNPLASSGLIVTKVMAFFKGEKHISPLVDKMAFGSYNKRFEGESSRRWLTNDNAVIARYEKDKFCNYRFTVSAMHDLIKLNQLSNRNRWYDNIRHDLPIYLIAGECDPVGDYGKGVTAVFEQLKEGGADVHCKLYKGCRHEILNDICREEVFSDILAFIG